jgi:N-carbamoyl-L-amino-acid hydrolase
MNFPRVDRDRLWKAHEQMAVFGALPGGGCCRLALTTEDQAARDLLTNWGIEAGCSVSTDTVGNIFIRREGCDPDRAPVLVGSHLDTQPSGGRFDGVSGVLAGIEVIRCLNDYGIETQAPVEVVNWTNEEGVRFSPGQNGSGVFAGLQQQKEVLKIKDANGVNFGQALEAIAYAGDRIAGDHPIEAYLELHIEQGPILDAMDIPIGIVTDVQGMRWFEVTVSGESAHAGATPIEMRRDAMPGAIKMASSVFQLLDQGDKDLRLTIGQVKAHPGSINSVPGEVRFSIDLRHPDLNIMDQSESQLKQEFIKIAQEQNLDVSTEKLIDHPPVRFDPNTVDTIRGAVRKLEYRSCDIISGATHDAVCLSHKVPSAMIFIPCEGGISHNEAEYASQEHLGQGADVLLHAVLNLAGEHA